MKVKLKKLSDNARIPEYATNGSACFDLFTTDDGLVHESSSLVLGTGLAFEVPKDHVMLVFSRSGDGFQRDVRLSNCVGVIDSDYRGELKVKLAADSVIGRVVKAGDRVAQALVLKYDRVTFDQVGELSDTSRGEGGFGSTGR